jgi:hypothetical protein
MEVAMNDEIAGIWRDQMTPGLAVPLDEIKRRVQRLKTRLNRRRRLELAVWIFIGVTAGGGLLFFGYPVSAWLQAAQLVLYVLVFMLMTPPWVQRAPGTESRVLTLNMLAVVTPCVDFYRKELEARYATLRHARKLAPILVLFGALFAFLGTQRPSKELPSVLAGVTVMVVAFFWYRRIKRQFPQVQAELADLGRSGAEK